MAIKNNDFSALVVSSSLLSAQDEIQAGTFAHIEYEAEEKLPKKLGIGGIVTKHVVGCVQMRYTYENAVNNRLEKQGDERNFVAQSLKWGRWFVHNLFIEHKGEVYLRYYTFQGENLHTTYFVNGLTATKEQEQLIRAYKANKETSSNTQGNAGLTENQVRPCALNVRNLISLDCGNYHYHRNEDAIKALKDVAIAHTII